MIDGVLPRWAPAQAGVFGSLDPFLDPGVGPVPGFQERQLSDPAPHPDCQR